MNKKILAVFLLCIVMAAALEFFVVDGAGGDGTEADPSVPRPQKTLFKSLADKIKDRF